MKGELVLADKKGEMKRTYLGARRAVFGLYIALVALLLVAGGRLFYLTIIKGDALRVRAEDQQYRGEVLPSLRGTIYDSKMNVLAQSASVWRIIINPMKINDEDNTTEENKERFEAVISGIVDILELEEEPLRKKVTEYMDDNYGYCIIKKSVEYTEYIAIVEYADKNDLEDVFQYEIDTKRYYPDGPLASVVLGFTGDKGVGRYGLELYYEERLKGVDGKIFTLYDSRSNELDSANKIIYDRKNGESPVLTLNNEIQTILRNACVDALNQHDADGVYGVVMNTKTGAILGLCNVPDFDPNNPNELTDQRVIEKIEAETDPEKKSQLYRDAQFSQWRNKVIADTYYPGSVYKVFLVAGALEEGVIDENTNFTCHGTISVGDRTIKDFNPTGHGDETPMMLLVNSCNTFSVEVGLRMGQELFFKYYEAFGFTQPTGVDMTGESELKAGTAYKSPYIGGGNNAFTRSDLASVSFGQTNTVTALQIAAGISAIGNGGKLMTPFVVQKTVDDNGNTIWEREPEVKRQVISEKTAKTVASYMEQVVISGTGKNAYVQGYHVAGKTGTSENTDTEDVLNDYVASFAGFAPVDDPEITVVIVITNPKGEQYTGGDIAAPVAKTVFEKVLPYLGVEPSYSEAELNELSAPAPNLVGKTVAEAKSELSSTKHNVRIIGDGEKVVYQSPEPGRQTPPNGVIVLYTESNIEKTTAIVPDFSGMTISQANQLAVKRGFNLRISGNTLSSDGIIAYAQDYPEGTELELGSVIVVSFKSSGILD